MSMLEVQTSFDKDQGSCLAMVKKVEDLLLQHVLSLFKLPYFLLLRERIILAGYLFIF